MKTKNQELIILLYQNLLGREPEEGAVLNWLQKMDGGLETDELVKSFIESKEFKIRKGYLSKLFRPPGHFYSPIVDTDNIKLPPRNHKDDLHGIDINKEHHESMWKKLLPHLKKFPLNENKQNKYRYYYGNNAFCLGDAMIYFAMLLEFQPKRIIEVGSGYSSALLLDTIQYFLPKDVFATFIEPYPELLQSLLTESDKGSINIIPSGIQDVPLELFETLNAGDILFIDSTHILKTGSDVCHELFEILPILKPGVLIHIHDIFWPFEYPEPWVFSENRSWNELYAIRAYLMNQDIYSVLYFNDYASKTIGNIISEDLPEIINSPGGSLWLRKNR